MLKQSLIGATFLLSASIALAGSEYGSADEAKAMLERAVAAIKADKTAAIDSFNRNDPSFRDRDLFVFCFNTADGKFTAHEAMVARDVRAMNDAAGATIGAEMYHRAAENVVTEISYLSPFPGSTRRAEKRAFITRVADQVCGVSAYWFGRPGAPSL